jgi:hypothetical protein
MATHDTKQQFNRDGLELHEFTDKLDCDICHEPCRNQTSNEKAYTRILSDQKLSSTPHPLKISYYEHNAVAIKLCGHVFGMTCLQTWLRDHRTCPMCRQELFPPTTHEHRAADLLLRRPSSFYSKAAFAILEETWPPADIMRLRQTLAECEARYEEEVKWTKERYPESGSGNSFWIPIETESEEDDESDGEVFDVDDENSYNFTEEELAALDELLAESMD